MRKMPMKYKMVLTFCLGAVFSMGSDVIHASALSQDVLVLPITTLSGETINLGQYKDKQPVYLKFWATWCKPCRKQMPHFQEVQEKHGEKIKVIGVNLGVNDDIYFIRDTKREFGLTMPIAIDTSGQLMQAFNLIGTPYHVLIDKNGNIVHTGHKASKEIDKKIKLLAENESTELPDMSLSFNSGVELDTGADKNKYTALFFVATWCDWYLKESRPSVSKNCINAQNTINTLYKQFPQYNWVGIASRLWTEEKELEEYKAKFGVFHPLDIDTSNKLFFNYRVKNFPTLILMKEGEEVTRVSKFKDQKQLIDKLRRVVSNI